MHLSVRLSVCLRSHACCTVCKKIKNAETESWKAEQLRHNERKHTPLICISCKRDGFTPTGRETYPCDACKKRRPRGMFAVKPIANWKTAPKNKPNISSFVSSVVRKRRMSSPDCLPKMLVYANASNLRTIAIDVPCSQERIQVGTKASL